MITNGFIHFQTYKQMYYTISHIRLLFSTFKYIKHKTVLNFLKIIVSYLTSSVTRTKSLNTLPLFLSVEPADFCQLSCPQCPVGASNKHKGHLFENKPFNSFLNQQKSSLFHLIFYFQGEPTLNKNLPEMILKAHQSKIFTSTSTNGQAINSDMARSLVESGLDKIIVSIDGATQNVYQLYRVGGKLEKATQSIVLINYWKKQLKKTSPFVELQFVVFKTNEHEIDKIKRMAKELKVNKLTFKSAQIYETEKCDELMSTINKYARYKKNIDGSFSIKQKQPNRCFRLWSGGVLNVKGEVLPCCFDKNGEHSFGNINDSDFNFVYNNSKANKFRKSILQNRLQHTICRNCTSH